MTMARPDDDLAVDVAVRTTCDMLADDPMDEEEVEDDDEDEDDEMDACSSSNCSSSTEDDSVPSKRYWREQLEFLRECSGGEDDDEHADDALTAHKRAGTRAKPRKTAAKPVATRTRVWTQVVGFDDLKQWFHVPMKEAALHFGVQITSLKKMCRRNGIKRWPHRQVRSLSRAIDSIMSAMGTASPKEKQELEQMALELRQKRQSVIDFPNKQQSSQQPSSQSHFSTVVTKAIVSPSAFSEKEMAMMAPRLPRVRAKVAPLQAHTDGIKVEPCLKSELDDDLSPTSSNGSTKRGGRWLAEEHQLFLEGLRAYGKNWKKVAQVVPTRSTVQIRTHAQKFFKRMSQERLSPTASGKEHHIYLASDAEASAWFEPVELIADDCPSGAKFFDQHRDFFPEFPDFDATLEQFQF
ncbi:hypothetical protein SDRG_03096 [Saprolegnia diclina VS20]|uniref:HTH myb-type domain-containing protein n=1 Tax=Saprolegnia diclina (strain VS20) TaxID=1156394 RepID=T0SA48_SAPDV|nr:hypothetical protein SDRG_03096 [Saprolegnia diclina VS20]EQC39667.1 hypothetical protein SDRG_03096 [Saprolegnia diclina VS20]|eukprot:XP_008606939.1 hypothetical protein SDRG_03096 [Saprolegnia diclina VS20]